MLPQPVRAVPATLPRLQGAPSQEPPFYRIFLRGAIVWGMSLGFTLGAALLLARTVGMPGHLGAAWWYGDVQTHGALQLLGWMTLMIMGVGLHVLPRFHGVSPVKRRHGVLLFGLMLAGLTARVTSHISGFLLGPTILPGVLEVASGALVLAATGLFAVLVLSILRSSARPDGAPSLYIAASALWLVAGALAHAGQMLYLALGQQLIIPDAFNEPVLHALLVGFGLQFTLGISQRVLPGWPGIAPLPRRTATLLWAALNAGLALRTGGLLASALTGMLSFETAARMGALVAALALAAFAVRLAPWRSQLARGAWKFPRADIHTAVIAAYAWLLLAALLEAGLTVRALGGVAPTYFDVSAVRHAYALGFLTLMVMGMAYRMVPAFGGTQLVWPGAYGVAVWLVLVSVTLRVPLTLAAGLLPPEAAALNGLSGVLGATGFVLWGVCIWRTLNCSSQPESHCPRKVTGVTLRPSIAADGGRPGPAAAITGSMSPAAAVERYPATLAVLVRFGFAALQNEQLRNTLGKTTTLQQAAAMHGVDSAELLEALNRVALAAPGARRGE